MYYKVSYDDLDVMLHADNEEQAKFRSLTLLQIKYPYLKFLETDDLVVTECKEEGD